MSTLNVSNITDGTTTVGTSYVVNGSAKAWINFIGTVSSSARDSLNVSSTTDGGTGTYTITFTSSFGAANYVAASTLNLRSGSATGLYMTDSSSMAAGSIGMTSDRVGTGVVDHEYNLVMFTGELA